MEANVFPSLQDHVFNSTCENNHLFLLVKCCSDCYTKIVTSAVLRLECSLDCIGGSVGHQQNIFRSFSHCRPIPGPLTKLRYNLPAIF